MRVARCGKEDQVECFQRLSAGYRDIVVGRYEVSTAVREVVTGDQVCLTTGQQERKNSQQKENKGGTQDKYFGGDSGRKTARVAGNCRKG